MTCHPLLIAVGILVLHLPFLALTDLDMLRTQQGGNGAHTFISWLKVLMVLDSVHARGSFCGNSFRHCVFMLTSSTLLLLHRTKSYCGVARQEMGTCAAGCRSLFAACTCVDTSRHLGRAAQGHAHGGYWLYKDVAVAKQVAVICELLPSSLTRMGNR